MPAIKVTKQHFTGNSHLYTGGPISLAAIIRALAVDHARIKIETTAVPDLTDNSTGVAAASFVDMVVPTVAFNATVAGGAQQAALNTSFTKIENAGKVLVNSFNNVRARLGLQVLGAASGVQAAADTIPALDLTATTANGVSAVDYVSGVASLNAAKANLRKLIRSFNETLIAIGETPLTVGALGSFGADYNLVAVPAAAASATGASSISKTVGDAFLAAVAKNIATMAATWNAFMFQAGLTDLTDNSGGVAALGLAANPIPALAAGAATTSSPKAGFDARLVVIDQNISNLAARMNTLRLRYGLPAYTDNTGNAATTTLAAQNAGLTAVDGTLAANGAVDGASARARMLTIQNAESSLAVGINALCASFGLLPLTDALTGTTKSTVIADVPPTAAAVGENTVPGGTLLDAAVDTWLTNEANNFATLAAKLNAMTGVGVPTKPLGVVAA